MSVDWSMDVNTNLAPNAPQHLLESNFPAYVTSLSEMRVNVPDNTSCAVAVATDPATLVTYVVPEPTITHEQREALREWTRTSGPFVLVDNPATSPAVWTHLTGGTTHPPLDAHVPDLSPRLDQSEISARIQRLRDQHASPNLATHPPGSVAGTAGPQL